MEGTAPTAAAAKLMIRLVREMRIRARAMIPYNEPRLMPLMKLGADIPKKNCTTTTKATAAAATRPVRATGEDDRIAVWSALLRTEDSGSGGGGGASGASVAVTDRAPYESFRL